jgi:uncharacterized PurR-regulated membrane protein YhhQ (DUF165 family)
MDWTLRRASAKHFSMSAAQILTFLQRPEIAIPICAATVLVFLAARRPWTAIYVALMPLINWSFSAVETYSIPEGLGGGQFQPLAIVTGFVLVMRDFAQREIKNWVLAAMLVGLALSTLTSWIAVVLASGAAFLISETVDWAVYTFTKHPLSQRILLSSAVSAPLDQVVFIYLASFAVPGIFAWGTIITGIVSKLVGAAIVASLIARRERLADMKAV